MNQDLNEVKAYEYLVEKPPRKKEQQLQKTLKSCTEYVKNTKELSVARAQLGNRRVVGKLKNRIGTIILLSLCSNQLHKLVTNKLQMNRK